MSRFLGLLKNQYQCQKTNEGKRKVSQVYAASAAITTGALDLSVDNITLNSSEEYKLLPES